ncbi:hypothetical protein LTR84_005721 [Exophiala bonariae]|uniref:Small ribosomal subunit protein mS33 n=1 Tax=Exophiala bonariae TaxID=1690606 RepID=A0AAV9N3C6_9EURO|nr:hypothetical protein LTR84_005721 [Exophiala bonariae]
MALPSRGRLLELSKLQCSIFSHTFNPNRQRLGNKILRQRLKGPTMAAYYPRKSVAMGDILKEFEKFGLAGYDEEELQRVDSVNTAKMRGKGAPKKKRTAAEGRAAKKAAGKK